ncbi:MAG: flavodoxin [Alteromonadaceae bacterium]|jgi:flavodoxin
MANILIIAGSVYGGAAYVAEQAMELLQGRGHQVSMTEAPKLADITSDANDTILVISSTTGQGDLPDNLVGFHAQLNDKFPLIPNKRFGVIALGDSSYGETYCNGGRQMETLFTELQAVKVGERFDIDACEVLQPEDEALPWIEQWEELL